MNSAFILDRKAFVYLWELCGGNALEIPDELRVEISEKDILKITDNLCSLGLLYLSGETANVERTVGFIIKSMINAKKKEKIGGRNVFFGEKLIILLEFDSYSEKKYRIIPLQNELALNDFFEEEKTNEICHR